MRLSWGKASIDLKGPTNLQVRGALANFAGCAAAAMLGWLIWILWKGPWAEAGNETQRIQGLTWLAIIMACLMGLAMFYLWQLLVKKIAVSGPGGFSANLDVAEDSDQSPDGAAPTAAATIVQLQEAHQGAVPADQVADAAVDEADRIAK